MWNQSSFAKTSHHLWDTSHIYNELPLPRQHVGEPTTISSHSHMTTPPGSGVRCWITVKVYWWLWLKYHDVCLCIHVEKLYPIPCPGDVQQVPGFLSSMLPLKMTGTLLWRPPAPPSESLTYAFKPHTVTIHLKDRTKGSTGVFIQGKRCQIRPSG